MSLLDVGDMSPAEVLRRLYNASSPLGLGLLDFKPEDMTPEQAQTLIDARLAQWASDLDDPKWTELQLEHRRKKALYFDYLHGRVMKIYADERPLDVRLYDRDNGPGAAARALGVTP